MHFSFISPAILPLLTPRHNAPTSLRPRLNRRPRRPARCTLNAANASDNSSLASQIAASFVAACAPTGVPYATAVRNFVKHALEAYTRGYSLAALRLELREPSPRPLASDEAELRDVWLSLVYKTLRAVRFPGAGARDGAPPDHFDAFVRSIVAAKQGGSDLTRIQLEHAVDGDPRSPLESAILRQSTRLVVATIDVADEMRGAF